MKRLMNGFLILVVTFCSFQAKAQTLEEAIVMTEKDLFEDAEKALKNLIAQSPDNATLYFHLGENFIKTDMVDSALNYYTIGLSKDPNSALNIVGQGHVKLYEKKTEEAKALFEKAVTLTGEKDAYVMEKIIEAYVTSGMEQLEYALSLCEKAIKLAPKRAELYLLLGEANLNAFNDGSTAITNYEKAGELNPKSSQAKLKIGELYIRTRSFDEALQNYEEAIAIAPDFAPAYRAMGELFFLFNRYEKAKENYAKYLDLAKNNLPAKIKYAKFLYLAKDYAATVSEIESIISLHESRGKEVPLVLYRLLGYSYSETGNNANGLSMMQKFLDTENPARILPSDYFYYGKLLIKNKQDSAGIVNLTKAYELDTTNKDALTELGNAYRVAKKYDQAITFYQMKVDQVSSPSTYDYFLLGQAYYSDSQYVKSDSIFAIVAERAPDNINGVLWRARSNFNMDPEIKEGLADTLYVKVLEMAELDAEKYKKELIEGNYYFAFKYYMMKNKTEATAYNEKVLAIDAANKRSLDMKKLIDKLANN